MKLFAIRHKETQSYLQVNDEAGNYLVDLDDQFFTSGDKTHVEDWLTDDIYIEDEGELDPSEFEIVEFDCYEVK